MKTQIIRRFCPAAAVAAVFFTVSCGSEPQPSRSTSHLNRLGDSIVTYNKGVVQEEYRQIDDYLSRYHWNMTISATGLRSMIYRKGTGARAMQDALVTVGYTVRLLNGDLCYSFEKEKARQIRIGHSTAERGLEEGILLLREGDRAKFIVPSHLAFGLLGDQGRIPARAVLVYDVELLKVQVNPEKH